MAQPLLVIPSFQNLLLIYSNRPLLFSDNNSKTFDFNNYVLVHKKKSCIYFSTLPHIHSFT